MCIRKQGMTKCSKVEDFDFIEEQSVKSRYTELAALFQKAVPMRD
jgi:hypothetical protein